MLLLFIVEAALSYVQFIQWSGAYRSHIMLSLQEVNSWRSQSTCSQACKGAKETFSLMIQLFHLLPVFLGFLFFLNQHHCCTSLDSLVSRQFLERICRLCLLANCSFSHWAPTIIVEHESRKMSVSYWYKLSCVSWSWQLGLPCQWT